MKNNDILLSPKHGLNPSILHCICCGENYGIALLGKLKGDKEAPKEISQGLCPKCQNVVDQGGALIIEVRDGETGDNPYRTGRLVGVSKNFKEKYHIEHALMYMEKSSFSKVFGNVTFTTK